MKKIILLFGLLALISTGLFAQGKVYQIGDVGPAGGIVFFDKGSESDGWRYLEAAPEETEFKDVEWGGRNKDCPGTLIGIGTGKANTVLIVEHLGQLKNEKNRAAQLCDALEVGSFDDWFLPSKDELNLMYTNLKEKGLGGFRDTMYWSSSQHNKKEACAQAFGYAGMWNFPGFQPTNNKFDKRNVRAIRAF